MSHKILQIIFFLILTISANSQYYRLSGIVLDYKVEPLALASVEVKELKRGKITKDDGSFEFFLERGKYDLVVSMVGYAPKIKTVFINNADVLETIVLELDTLASLAEVVIRTKMRDRAEDYVRNVIRNKDAILASAGSYSCNIYIKAFQQDSSYKRAKSLQEDSMGTEEFKYMSLAEISLEFDRHENGQIKEQRSGVNKRGNTESLFYQSGTEADFNLYNNLIKAPAISSIPFVSPISYSGLLAYRFKTLNIDRSGKRKIYTISVKPRQLSNATIEGVITIEDSLWVILSADFSLPSGHLPEYDFFEVLQQYKHIGDSVWMIARQQFNYNTKMKGGRRYGETTALYSDFEFRKDFPKKYFGNEVSTTASEAYEKDSVFWNMVRREPLSVQQHLYARYQDSIYQYMRTEQYLDSMDRVLNKITWDKLLIFGQIFNNHKKERMWVLPPVSSLIQPIYFGGLRFKVQGAYKKVFESKKNLSVELNTSFGFLNKDINGGIEIKRLYNPVSRGMLSLKAVRDFEFIYQGDAWVNILKRSNIFLNNAVELGHEIEIVNGLHIFNYLEFALRRSVSNYKVSNKSDTIFGIPNPPAVDFDPYNAAYYQLKLYYTPKLKYIREPKEKIFLGSKWPTFYMHWRKGFPNLFKSKVDFSYLEFGVKQNINLGVAGISNYTIKTGSFTNTKDLRVIDYHYLRQGDPFFFQNPNRTMQALDSTFPVFDWYYQGNLVHEFNGALLSKIPFMKKLKLQEVAGAGFIIAPEKDLRYVEMFAGIERVFRWPFNPLQRVKLGFYVVGSVANKFNNPVQFKFGLTTWDRFRNEWR